MRCVLLFLLFPVTSARPPPSMSDNWRVCCVTSDTHAEMDASLLLDRLPLPPAAPVYAPLSRPLYYHERVAIDHTNLLAALVHQSQRVQRDRDAFNSLRAIMITAATTAPNMPGSASSSSVTSSAAATSQQQQQEQRIQLIQQQSKQKQQWLSLCDAIWDGDRNEGILFTQVESFLQQ